MLEKLLERINQQEFELLSDEIKQALSEHHLWMHRISMAIASRTPIEELSFTEQNAHLHCKFGSWLRNLLTDEQFQGDEFDAIDELHQKLHKSGRKLLLNLNKSPEFDEETYANFLTQQREFFNAVLKILEFSIVSENQFDHTTKLMNRRSVYTILAHEKHRMQRTEGSHCCIALADIDRFKAFNDKYGHDVGDIVLEHVASLFNNTIRRYDSVARFGGEEFLFVLPDMDVEDAVIAIERVRLKLASSVVEHQGKELSVTASFGITQLCPHCDINGSLKRADVALYRAKDLGRNKTVCVDSADLFKDISRCSVDPDGKQLEEFITEHCTITEH